MQHLLLAAVTTLRLAWASLFGGAMDGTAWDVKVKRDSFFSFPRHETLVFDGGQLRLDGTFPASFENGVYKTSAAMDEGELWNASSSSPDGGTLSWQGLVRGDHIEGVAVWWTKDGRQKRYVFDGSRKSA